MRTVVAVLFVLFCSMIVVPAQAQDQPLPAAEPTLRVDITSMSPRVVTQSDRKLTITAKVRNVSDVPVHALEARLQLGLRLDGERGMQDAIRGLDAYDHQATLFQPLAEVLEPKETAKLRIEADLRGEQDEFVFGEPGQYPLLLNVNGVPDGAAEARLATVNLLLPVRELPGGDPATAPEQAQRVGVLWPITSRPRVVADPAAGPLVLTGEGLAKEMRSGGRLHALVSTAADAKQAGDGELLCFAVDPDLVATAQAMTNGYRVRTKNGGKRGEGADDARAWLKSLRSLVQDSCVLPTPYAGADIASLATVEPDLATAAADNDATLRRILDVKPVDGVIWTSGKQTEESARALSEVSKTAVSADDLGKLALEPGTVDEQLTYPAKVAADERTIATQNAVSTVLFRAANRPGADLLLAPPQTWQLPDTELQWLLRTLGELREDSVIEPYDWTTLQPAELDVTTDGDTAPTTQVTKRLAGLADQIRGLSAAMAEDSSAQVDPDKLTVPLREALLRAASTQLDGAERKRAVQDAVEQLNAVRGRVRISDPGRIIALASGSSPIPVTIKNGLPVEVTVQVQLSVSPGLRLTDVSAIVVPAGRSRNLKIPSEALRAGRFTVDLELTTPDGTSLGEPTRFDLTSTEYGTITVIVTATAGGVLLLLAGRRIHRRLRANGAAKTG